MNKENLQRMADFIKTIPQASFSMEVFRFGKNNTPKCSSIGCVVGHCTVLDKENLTFDENGDIEFLAWSEKFTGLSRSSNEWDWCFSGGWTDNDDTPIGAAKRIEWLINKGLPEDWKEQYHSEKELCYE